MKENNIVFAANTTAGLPRARAHYLNQAIQLEETTPVGIINIAIIFSGMLFIALVLWAHLTQIKEVATTRGEVIPADLIHNVQHLEGGIVSEILVRNGDLVNKGDTLLRFAPPATMSDLEQMLIRHASLLLQQERLQALIEKRKPDFGNTAKNYPELAEHQRTIYQAQLNSQQQKIAVIDQQIEQKKSEKQRSLNQKNIMKEEVSLLEEQVSIRKRLNKTGVVARDELLTTQIQLSENMREYQQFQDDFNVAKTTLSEVRQRRKDIEFQFIKDIHIESGQITNELAEVEQTLIRLNDRAERLNVVAPVTGIVQALAINSINAVAEPGKIILRLVPMDDELIVEARILPKDIGHVHIGQSADVKVDSYDSSRFGSIDGKVKQISATTYLDERNNPYYRAEITLNQAWVGDNPEIMKIIPGMTVQSNIETGEKSVLAYLLRPVSRGLDNAFSER
ncbi:MAG TPA: HlyD family type I secretion periplasmic adaptor subunit [Gammaproteobacteria bacterium]|nr:HlyD family type I secretion periplasmic adaptor subunit [Gammaproteobacteria bacterium]